MDTITRDIAILSGNYTDLFKVTLRNLRAALDAQLIVEPTWTSTELITWTIEGTGTPIEILSEDYISAVTDCVVAALALDPPIE